MGILGKKWYRILESHDHDKSPGVLRTFSMIQLITTSDGNRYLTEELGRPPRFAMPCLRKPISSIAWTYRSFTNGHPSVYDFKTILIRLEKAGTNTRSGSSKERSGKV